MLSRMRRFMNSNRRPRTNRRTVLKSITAGSGAFLSTTNVVGSAGDRVEVVMEWQGNDPYVTRKVPKRWKQHMGTTRRLASELTEHFKDDGDIFGFERIPGSLNRGGKSAPQLGARVRKGSGA